MEGLSTNLSPALEGSFLGPNGFSKYWNNDEFMYLQLFISNGCYSIRVTALNDFRVVPFSKFAPLPVRLF